MAQSETVSLQRVLVWSGAVLRHIRAITVAFMGSALFSLPAWLKPLLPVEYTKQLDKWSAFSAEPQVYWYLAVACMLIGILCASFLAWNEERAEAENMRHLASQNEPNLEITIQGFVHGVDSVNQAKVSVLLIVEVKNLGADSIADHYELSAMTFDGRKIIGTGALMPEKFDMHGDWGVVTYYGEDWLYKKTGTEPVRRGAKTVGILLFTFEVPRMLLNVDTLELTARDVRGNILKAGVNPQSRKGSPLYYPGLKRS